MDDNMTSDTTTSTPAPTRAASDDASSSTVFVGSLAWATDATSLRNLFESNGLQIAPDQSTDEGFTKKSVVVVSDRETGRSRGYGFVTLISPEEAQKAVNELNEKELDGRSIRVQVKENRPREDRPRRTFNSSDRPRRSFGTGARSTDRRFPRRDDRGFDRVA